MMIHFFSTKTKVALICLAVVAIWSAELVAADNRNAVDDSNAADNSNAVETQDKFNESRYIDVDQITPGMRGYGLTVFQGTKPERFDVVAVSVIRNVEPNRNAILIRCSDQRFTLAKGVQGVSGSPVFFDGRMAGAMSYTWIFGEEPLYRVTPIREMLEVRQTAAMGHKNKADAGRKGCFESVVYHNLMRKTLLEPEQIALFVQEAGFAGESAGRAGSTALPLAMAVSGINEHALSRLRQRIPTLNLEIASGGGQSPKQPKGGITLEPGATLSIPLIMGDMNAAVIGTVTEVIGGDVYGFGHPWNADGATLWPMGTGYIHTFVSRKSISFKLGHAVEIVGAIQADEIAAVYGKIGVKPPLVPVSIEVEWPHIGRREQINIQMAQDRRKDPVLAAMAAVAAVLNRGGLPRDHTISYQIEMRFEEMEPIIFDNVSSNQQVDDLIDDILGPLALILNNPWEQVRLTDLKMKATITDEAGTGEIRSVQLFGGIFHPGQTVKAVVLIQPLRGETSKVKIELKLPDDLPEGTYKINVGSPDVYSRVLRQAQPLRYTAFDTKRLGKILGERLSMPRNSLYMSMTLPRPGLSIEQDELPYLPASRNMMLSDKSRKITTAHLKPMATAAIDTNYIVSGKKIFEIEVRKNADR